MQNPEKMQVLCKFIGYSSTFCFIGIEVKFYFFPINPDNSRTSALSLIKFCINVYTMKTFRSLLNIKVQVL